jgi:acyl-CoA synthetase (AMP-forming)/AMP-acid ligase II
MIDIEAIAHVADIARHNARVRPDKTAMWFEGRTTSYGTLDTRASQIANGLARTGVKPGDRVAYLGKNSDVFYEIALGSAKARTALAGINYRLAAPETAFILNDAAAPILFVEKEFFPLVEAILADCPKLKTIIALTGAHDGWIDYATWRDSQSATDPDLGILPDDDVVQLYTSGTTGLPKGVQLTHANYRAFFDMGSRLEWASYHEDDAVLVAMPLFHVAGVNVGLLALAQGSEAVIIREINPPEILKLMPEKKIAHAFFVPAVLLALLHTPGCDKTDFSALKNIFYGASPIAEDLLIRSQAMFGARFTQLYGLTETIGATTFLPPEAHNPKWGKLRSCGVPWPGILIRTVDANDQETAPGEVGEIIIKADIIMKGYWNRPEASAEALKGGWFRTGDAGYFDEEGFLYIHDRVKDMIVSGGENVYPAEVENAIFGHPGVADVAVIGVPDDKWGESVKAIVVKKPGTDPEPASIIAYARDRIAGYKLPKSVDFIDALPRNPSGKILRRELREPYWKGRDRQVS